MPSDAAAIPQTPPLFASGDLVVLSPADGRVKEIVEAKWVERKGAWAYRCREVDDPESTHITYPERVLLPYQPPAAPGPEGRGAGEP